jgi:hypothetical protein
MTRMNRFSNGPLNVALTILLAVTLAAPGLTAKERRGAKIDITKLDKSVVEGELLSIRGDDLTILDLSSATEVTVSLFEVKDIFILRPTKMVTSVIVGALAFGVPAVLYGAENGKGGPVLLGSLAAVGGGLTGLLVAGMSDDILVDLGDPASLTRVKARLKKHARYRN